MRAKSLYAAPRSAMPRAHIVHRESAGRKAMDGAGLRILSILLVFGLSFLALSFRLVEVSLVGGGDLPFRQLVENPHLLIAREEAKLDNKKTAPVAKDHSRRQIVDRNGEVLALNVKTASLVANPKLIRHSADVARRLGRIFPDMKRSEIEDRLSQKSRFTYIRRQLTPEQQQQVNALGVPGLFFEPGYKRVYPHGEMASHLLGYVGVDSQGLAGVEQYFDKDLSDPFAPQEPIALSLDMRAQAVMYEELQETMGYFGAIGAAGVLVDIHSGEVLSMVSLPGFNPHQPTKESESELFNRVSLGTYEMGSTFKTFTMAMGLHYDVVDMKDGYDTSDPIRAAGFTIRDYHPMRGWNSIGEIFAKSSNIGTVKLAMEVGGTRQREFFRKIGLMTPVDIELPERVKPQMPKQWREINAMTASYGHGISVTPLHMMQAFSAVVNGEKQPLTLKKDGNQGRGGMERVVSESTARDLRQMLRRVVTNGTASKANIAGYRVGGKTGTAEKFRAGSYKDDEKVTSFISAFPMDSPRYALLVMVDEPKGRKSTHGYATAGWVAVPAAGRIIERIAPMLGVKPVLEMKQPKKEPQKDYHLEVQNKRPAANAIRQASYRYDTNHTGQVHHAAQ